MTKKPLYTDGFDEFWAAYPRKQGKKYALRCWSKIRPDEILLNKILISLEWQCSIWAQSEIRFVPMPSTYLNQERWDDEPPKEILKQSKKNNLTEEQMRKNVGL